MAKEDTSRPVTRDEYQRAYRSCIFWARRDRAPYVAKGKHAEFVRKREAAFAHWDDVKRRYHAQNRAAFSKVTTASNPEPA